MSETKDVEMLSEQLKEPKTYKNKPKVCTPKQAALYMIGKKKIAVLTGAGISAASGIPTFRGRNGFWKKSKRCGESGDPQKLLTNGFF